MSGTLEAWTERVVLEHRLAGLAKNHANASEFEHLFDTSGTDKNAHEMRAELVKFVGNPSNKRQVERLRGLVARCPQAWGRWAEFIEHELERKDSELSKQACNAAKCLANGFRSPKAREAILENLSTDLKGFKLKLPSEEQAKWMGRLFLTLVDSVLLAKGGQRQ